jgi:hypothetical protein
MKFGKYVQHNYMNEIFSSLIRFWAFGNLAKFLIFNGPMLTGVFNKLLALATGLAGGH